MKKEIKKFIIFVVFGILILNLIWLVSAGSCSDSDTIMKLYSENNSHGSLWNDVYYTYDICYSDIFGVVGTGNRVCIGTNKVLGLHNMNNSHAQKPGLNTYNNVCYGDLECVYVTAGNCATNYKCVVTLFNEDNSHLADCNSTQAYSDKICCKIKSINSYWADMEGNPITKAEIGDTVLMIYKYMAGQSYNFEVFEDDLSEDVSWFDDNIRTMTNVFDYGGDLATKWVITQSDFDKGDSVEDCEFCGNNDEEFYFKIDGINSPLLIIDKDSFNNSIHQTQIINPIAETNYVIRSGQINTNIISFNQSSSDEDDDLSITWKFGDGQSASFNDCLTGVNCNTTYQYTAVGTKNIILSTQEMSRNSFPVKDYSRIYVYGEGTTVFVVFDQIINGRLVELDATKTKVSDCYYIQGNCEGSPGNYGVGNCYEIVDTIDPLESIWCYDKTLRVDGIDSNPNLFLGWTVKSNNGNLVSFTPKQNGNQMKYIKIFDEPGEHVINLNIGYDPNNP